jgi:hypothetical protein
VLAAASAVDSLGEERPPYLRDDIPANPVRTGRPPLYDLVADVCETFPRIGQGDRLAPEEYRRPKDLHMRAAEALDEMVDQTRSMSKIPGMAIESDLLILDIRFSCSP